MKRLDHKFGPRSDKGAVMVESSFAITLLVAATFIFISLCIGFYRAITVQYALQRTARWAAIGNVSETTQGIIRSPYSSAAIDAHTKLWLNKFGVSLPNIQIRACALPAGGAPCAASNAYGSSNQSRYFMLSTEIPLEVFSYRFRTISLRAVERSEPWS